MYDAWTPLERREETWSCISAKIGTEFEKVYRQARASMAFYAESAKLSS
jgi:hypothetical protein